MEFTDEDLALLFDLGRNACLSGEGILPVLRTRFPGLPITQCPAGDVSDEPFRTGEYFDLHLLDTRDHCWKVTSDFQAATGLLLAMHRSTT
ncbi:hypothetical protein ACJU26_06845 [Acidithiobacillus sp. M4-SHS-6]|uniref:hypothetical protein n=1 Tax=Acidithiobacillus sp. M4-SHS-6 TaxID=3383024 RepID=UPI0039BEC799